MSRLNIDALQEQIKMRESSGDYTVINDLGYVGGYQFGAPALEDLGLLKKGASKGGNKALKNPNNWTLPGGLEAFLSDTELQDAAFVKYASINLKRMKHFKLFDSNTPPADLAGMLAVSHLKGVGALLDNEDSADGYGTKESEYYALGAKSQEENILSESEVLKPSILSGDENAKHKTFG